MVEMVFEAEVDSRSAMMMVTELVAKAELVTDLGADHKAELDSVVYAVITMDLETVLSMEPAMDVMVPCP